jgi:hypothetical protein
MGRYAEVLPVDGDGNVTVHDSPRYRHASDHELGRWAWDPCEAVRAAAKAELASRRLAALQ